MAEYITLAELKSYLRITDSVDDAQLSMAITAASGRIDAWTGRLGAGFALDSVASARTYRANTAGILLVDAIGSLTDLTVETGAGVTWTAVTSDAYEFGPDNALATGRAIESITHLTGGWPYRSITRVRVTARWGWPAVPAAIKQATLIDAVRLFKRKDSPEGVAGFGDYGPMRIGAVDPDVRSLLAPYVLPGFA